MEELQTYSGNRVHCAVLHKTEGERDRNPTPNGAAEKPPLSKELKVDPLFITMCNFVLVDNFLGHLKPLQREKAATMSP